MSVVLAIDGMGGDHAPFCVVDGMALAASKIPNLKFKLFGDEEIIQPLLLKHKVLQGRVDLIHTTETVDSDTKPSLALRGFKDSSMRRAIGCVSDGHASGVVSSGNTGAYMALSRFIFRMIPGIERPAIVTLIPNTQGSSVFLDLGANAECTSRNLLEFAIMGQAYGRVVLDKEHPSVALLNIGSEDLKGNTIVQEAAELIRDSKCIHNFMGFVEGDDITAGGVDVIVCDGFTGNIALKAIEGVIRFIVEFLKTKFQSSLWFKICGLIASPALRSLKNYADPRNHNGAMFLGLNGLAIKSHGGSDAIGFAHAIQVAHNMVVQDLNNLIARSLNHVTPNSEI